MRRDVQNIGIVRKLPIEPEQRINCSIHQVEGKRATNCSNPRFQFQLFIRTQWRGLLKQGQRLFAASLFSKVNSAIQGGGRIRRGALRRRLSKCCSWKQRQCSETGNKRVKSSEHKKRGRRGCSP